MTTPIEVAKDLFCGVMSGWAQVVSMLPFENIKIKLISKPDQYNQGIAHAVKKTISEEGVLSLFKGMLFPLIGVGAQVSVQFGVVESLKKIFNKTMKENNQEHLHVYYTTLAGFISGVPSAIIVTPLDHARFKVTLIKEAGLGSVGMAKLITHNYGLRTLYLGFAPTLIRETIGLAAYFGVYDLLIQHFRQDGKVNLLGSMACGAIAGMSFQFANYPIDYIKTLIQSDQLDSRRYNGIADCFKQNRHRGVRGFYTGFSLMVTRALVANAFGFLAFEVGKRMLY